MWNKFFFKRKFYFIIGLELCSLYFKTHCNERDEGLEREEDLEKKKEIYKNFKKKLIIYREQVELEEIFEALNLLDVNNEFPFFLIIYIDRNNIQIIDYEELSSKINEKFSQYVSEIDNKKNKKIFLIVYPVDVQIQNNWQENIFSSISNLSPSLPTLLLVCRQKNCLKCKNTHFTLVSSYCGAFFPKNQWYKMIIHNQITKKNPEKLSLPYEVNTIGILNAILLHNFKKNLKKSN